MRAAPLLLAMTAPAWAQSKPVAKIGNCPDRYMQSGSFCALMRRDAPAALPKGAGQCPSGWMQSGSYCIEMRKR